MNWPSLKREWEIVQNADPQVRRVSVPCIPTGELKPSDPLEWREWTMQDELILSQQNKLQFANKVISGLLWLNVILLAALVYCVWF